MRDLLRYRGHPDLPPALSVSLGTNKPYDRTEHLFIPDDHVAPMLPKLYAGDYIFPPENDEFLDGVTPQEFLLSKSRGEDDVPYFEVAMTGDELEEILDRPAEEIVISIENEEYDEELDAVDHAERNKQNRAPVMDAILTRQAEQRVVSELEQEKQAIRAERG